MKWNFESRYRVHQAHARWERRFESLQARLQVLTNDNAWDPVGGIGRLLESVIPEFLEALAMVEVYWNTVFGMRCNIEECFEAREGIRVRYERRPAAASSKETSECLVVETRFIHWVSTLSSTWLRVY